MTQPTRRAFLAGSAAALATAACSGPIVNDNVPTPDALLGMLGHENDLMIAEYHHPDNWQWLGGQRDLWQAARAYGYRFLSLEMKAEYTDMVNAYRRGDMDAGALVSYLQQSYAALGTVPWIFDDARNMARGVVSTINAADRAGLQVVLTDYRDIPPEYSAVLYGARDPYDDFGPVVDLERAVRDECLAFTGRGYIDPGTDRHLTDAIRHARISQMDDVTRDAYWQDTARRAGLGDRVADPLGNAETARVIQLHSPGAPVIHIGGAAHILDGLYECPLEEGGTPRTTEKIHSIDDCLLELGRRFDSRNVLIVPDDIQSLSRRILSECLRWAPDEMAQRMLPDALVQTPGGGMMTRSQITAEWLGDRALHAKLVMP